MNRQLRSELLQRPRSQTAVIGVCASIALGFIWALQDFHDWTSFGTGGTPPTWLGYLKMTSLRIRHLFSHNDLIDPSPFSYDGPSFLPEERLPPRKGGRPQIMPHILPQRQRPETIDPSTQQRLHGLVHEIASQRPDLVETKPSHTEGRTTEGLYALQNLPTLNPVALDKILDHEIAHSHPADGSLHVFLSGRDARKVVEAGWGQRFPLTSVPTGWVMVYAPRNEAEMDVVEQIVRAGTSWVVGVTFFDKI